MTTVIKALPRGINIKKAAVAASASLEAPKQRSEKTTIEIAEPSVDDEEVTLKEESVIDLEDIKALETCVYTIACENVEKIKSVVYSLICDDNEVKLHSCLKIINDSNVFSIKVQNKSDKDRKLRVSYHVTF